MSEQIELLAAGQPVLAPEPALIVWVGCRRLSTPFMRVLPDVGGWLDQDLELTFAFDVLDDLFEQRIKEEELRRQRLEQAQRFFNQRR